MSTILDALRKVEEEKRAQETDVRTRLLANSARFDFRRPRRSRASWGLVGGFAATGIALGAGWLLWRSAETAPITEGTSSLTTPPQVASASPPVSPEPRRRKQESPSPQIAQITPEAGAVLPPEKSMLALPSASTRVAQITPAGPGVVITETTPQYDPRSGGSPQNIVGNAPHRQGTEALYRSSEIVQRSPFVNSSPSDRVVAPPPPSPTERRAIAAAKPSHPIQPASEKTAPTTPKTPVPGKDLSRQPSTPASVREESLGAPPGASLSFLQWSADPDKRVASIKVGTGPATLVHEGDSVEGMTVIKIRSDAVELRSGESRYLLKAR